MFASFSILSTHLKHLALIGIVIFLLVVKTNAQNSNLVSDQRMITLPNGATSATPIPNGSVVDVQGLFTINSNTTYTNVKFKMAAGARIDIVSGNTLTLT